MKAIKLLTIKQAAALMGVKDRTLRHWVDTGLIHPLPDMGARKMFTIGILDEFVARRELVAKRRNESVQKIHHRGSFPRPIKGSSDRDLLFQKVRYRGGASGSVSVDEGRGGGETDNLSNVLPLPANTKT